MNFKLGLILAAAALLTTVTAKAEPIKKAATFSTIYAPLGFDSNDNVQLVGEGMFRNTCYRPAPTEVAVDRGNKIIHVGPVAYEYSGMCLQLILPFERVIDVGILPSGTYRVVENISGTELGSVTVAETRTDSPDDYLYAPISQAFFMQKGAVSEIMLTGDFPTSCMHLDEVKINVQKKSIVIQPIVKVDEGGNCKPGKYSFSKLVKADLVPQGRYLLHVRSMNGKAINTLVDIKY